MKKTICTFVCLCVLYPALAIVTLPSVISDNMVIQRDLPVKLWGKADNNEAFSITLNGQTVKTKAGKDGVWRVQLKAMSYGGPYEMTVKGKNTVTLRNII
jgi:sialate O-acetylesterase